MRPQDENAQPGTSESAKASGIRAVVLLGAASLASIAGSAYSGDRFPGVAIYGVALGALAIVYGKIVRPNTGAERKTEFQALSSAERIGFSCLFLILPAIVAVYYATWLQSQGVRLRPSWDLPNGVVGALSQLIAVPLAEELYFRKLIHTELLALFGRPAVSVLANATWFAFGHSPHNLPTAFVVGVSTTLLVLLTGSLWPAVAAHVLNNAAFDAVAMMP